MVIYGILLLVLIPALKDEHPDINQPWYADDAGARGTFKGIRAYFEKVQEQGPRQGYFPEPSMSILIMREHNKDAAGIAFHDLGFTIVSASRYLKGFIGEASNQQLWIQEKTEAWVDSIKEMAMVAERYPQAAYAGLHKVLQQEWQFL
jgi:hypothetical protein